MSTLLVEIVPLALGAAISPVIFLLQLTTLTGPRPIARGSVLAAGAAAALIVVSTIGVLVGDTGFSTRDTLQAVINIVFGALLAAVGLRALVRPPKPRKPKSSARRPSLRGSFLAGVGGMASNVHDVRALHPGTRADRRKRPVVATAGDRSADHPRDNAHGGVGAARARGRCPRRIDPHSALARRMDEGEQPMDPARLGPRLRCLAPRQGRGWVVMRGSRSLRTHERASSPAPDRACSGRPAAARVESAARRRDQCRVDPRPCRRWIGLEAESGAGGDHRCVASVDGGDDLGVVDSLQVDRRDAEVGMP
jgi:hypothetical protein